VQFRDFLACHLQKSSLKEGFMKAAALLLMLAFAATAHADIQAPPASDYGPTRKLGRGIGNIAFGITEIPDNLAAINYSEGNSAAWSYGLVRGIGRTFARLGYGVYEVVLFPFPTQRGTYRPPYRSDIPWINSGYQEFPPELGFDTRYDYSRTYQREP
jgi:putative exosortase-associated protein (TIGR04073 family)